MKRFELFYPVHPYYLTQGFGENLNPIYKQLGMKGHNGEDLRAYDGQPCYAAQDGIVEEISTESERGLGVGIVTEEVYDLKDLGQYQIKHRYWHWQKINVVMGQKIKVGDLIGWCDNTGLSDGSHLHLECKPVKKVNGIYVNVYQNNGYFGAVRPNRFWNKKYAEDFKMAEEIVEKIKPIVETIKTSPVIQSSWLDSIKEILLKLRDYFINT